MMGKNGDVAARGSPLMLFDYIGCVQTALFIILKIVAIGDTLKFCHPTSDLCFLDVAVSAASILIFPLATLRKM